MPSTVVPNNTAKTAHIAWADTATGSQVVGTAIVVNNGTTKERAVRFFLKFGRRSGTAFTAGWPNIRFEVSSTDSGNGDWFTQYSYQAAVGASIANTTLNGAVSANATSFVVTSATNIAAGDMLFVKGNTDAENEIVRVKSVSGTTINLDDGTPIVAAKNTGNAVTDQAEMPPPFEFGGQSIRRIRAIVDNAGSGQTIAAEVTYTLFDAEYVS
jgi:hypothetical protein